MKPFLLGKKTLATAPLHSSARPSVLRTSLQAAKHAAAANVEDGTSHPVVEVVKEGDKVVRLVITCTCGERIEVECLYPAGS